MPMGIVSDDEFLLEVKNSSINNESLAIILPQPESGRGKGTIETPEVLREIIGESALVESNKTVASAFGISESSVSAYKIGATSTTSYNFPDQKLRKSINKSRERITNKASNRLNLALNSITEEKLQDVKARDAAGIAKDMSAIIKNLEPQSERDDNRVQFIFYSPKQKSESDYEIIHVDN